VSNESREGGFMERLVHDWCWKTNSHESTVITQVRAYDSG
jgi:hypothetical protein